MSALASILLLVVAFVAPSSAATLRAPQRVLSAGELSAAGGRASAGNPGALGGPCKPDTAAAGAPKSTCDGSLMCVNALCVNDPCHVGWASAVAAVLGRGGALAAPHAAAPALHTALAALLASKAAASLDGDAVRIHTADFPTLCSVTDGGGAFGAGGRWNARAQHAVYATVGPQAERLALAEGEAEDAVWKKTTTIARVPLVLEVKSAGRVLDLTKEATRAALCAEVTKAAGKPALDAAACAKLLLDNDGADWRALQKATHSPNMEPMTQAIGRAAAEVGFDGLFAPSSAGKAVGIADSFNSAWFVKQPAVETPAELLTRKQTGRVALAGGGSLSVRPLYAVAITALTSVCAAAPAPPPPHYAAFPRDFSAAVMPNAQAAVAPPPTAAATQHAKSAALVSAFAAGGIQKTCVDDILFRHQPAAFPSAADIAAGTGAKTVGGKYNAPGVPAIYLAKSSADAYAELVATSKAGDARERPATVLIALEVSGTLCDLTDDRNLAVLAKHLLHPEAAAPKPAAPAAAGEHDERPVTLTDADRTALEAMLAAPAAMPSTETLEQALGRVAAASGCGFLEVPSARSLADTYIVGLPGPHCTAHIKGTVGPNPDPHTPTSPKDKVYTDMFSRACPTTPAPQYEEEVDPRDALPAELVRVHIAHRRNAISPTTVTAASADGTCRLRANAVTAQADNADKHAPVPAPPKKL